jgi:hypothetical protein
MTGCMTSSLVAGDPVRALILTLFPVGTTVSGGQTRRRVYAKKCRTLGVLPGKRPAAVDGNNQTQSTRRFESAGVVTAHRPVETALLETGLQGRLEPRTLWLLWRRGTPCQRELALKIAALHPVLAYAPFFIAEAVPGEICRRSRSSSDLRASGSAHLAHAQTLVGGVGPSVSS